MWIFNLQNQYFSIARLVLCNVICPKSCSSKWKMRFFAEWNQETEKKLIWIIDERYSPGHSLWWRIVLRQLECPWIAYMNERKTNLICNNIKLPSSWVTFHWNDFNVVLLSSAVKIHCRDPEMKSSPAMILNGNLSRTRRVLRATRETVHNRN